MEKLEPSCPAGRKVKWCSSFAKQCRLILKELNTESLYEPATPLVIIYPGEMETSTHIKPCTQMFTAMLFTVAKKQKSLNINQLTYETQNGAYPLMEYCLAIKRNEVLIYTTI